MRILLDTHAFLWLVTDSPPLSPRARDLFLDSDNQLLLSADTILSEYPIERLW